MLERQILRYLITPVLTPTVERQAVSRRADRACPARRAQQHAGGHRLAPELERLAESDDGGTGIAQMCDGGEPVRAGADYGDGGIGAGKG